MERTRWGTISTSINPETHQVSQSVIKGGMITGEDFKSPKRARRVLSERQDWDNLVSDTLNLVGKSILAVVLVSEIKSVKEKRKLNSGLALIGGLLWAISHLASDKFRDKADFSAFKSEEVTIAQVKLKLERKKIKKEAKSAPQE